MNEKLKPFNREVLIMQGECLDVFKDLINQSQVKNIYSYQESGIPLTYKRDLKLKSFSKTITLDGMNIKEMVLKEASITE